MSVITSPPYAVNEPSWAALDALITDAAASLKRSHAGMRCALASPSVLSVTMEDGAASAIEGAAARLSGPGE